MEFLSIPAEIEFVGEPYAFGVLGESLQKQFPNADTLIVDDSAPTIKGDNVVIWNKQKDKPPAVYKLAMAVPDNSLWHFNNGNVLVVVENPDKTTTSIPIKYIEKIHRIVASIDNLGNFYHFETDKYIEIKNDKKQSEGTH